MPRLGDNQIGSWKTAGWAPGKENHRERRLGDQRSACAWQGLVIGQIKTCHRMLLPLSSGLILEGLARLRTPACGLQLPEDLLSFLLDLRVGIVQSLLGDRPGVRIAPEGFEGQEPHIRRGITERHLDQGLGRYGDPGVQGPVERLGPDLFIPVAQTSYDRIQGFPLVPLDEGLQRLGSDGRVRDPVQWDRYSL